MALSTFSIKTIYAHSTDSLHNVALLDFKRKIQTGLSFGKKLENFIGIEELINQARKEFATVSDIVIYDADGNMTVSSAGGAADIAINIRQSYPSGVPFYTFKKESSRHYCTTIKNSFSGEVEGYVCMHINEAVIDEKTKAHVKQSLIFFAVVFAIAAVVFLLVLKHLNSQENPVSYQKKITVVLITISLLSQIFFTLLNLRVFYQEHNADIGYKNTLVVSLLKNDVENFLTKKLPIDKIINIEKLMTQMIVIGEDVESLVVTNAKNEPLYHVHKDKQKENEALMPVSTADIAMPLYKQEASGGQIIEGYIYAFKDNKRINAYTKDVLINLLTIAFVSVIFMYEFIQFLFFFFSQNGTPLHAVRSSDTFGYRLIRPIIFLFMFSFDLTLSFLAIFAGTLYDADIGISKEMTMGLPLSIEMLFAAIAFIVGGKWSAKYSWIRFFIIGVLGVSVGSLFSATAQTIFLFLASRALIGFGYGLVISSLQSYIVQNTDQHNRTQAFGIMLAGLYSGSLCGSATGAILADLVGYGALFMISGFLVLFVFLFLRYLSHSAVPQVLDIKGEQRISFLEFISNRNMLGFLLFSTIPASAIAVGYVYYFIPIHMQTTGASQADIGRVILLYSTVIVYLAPFFGSIADKVKDKHIIIAFSSLVGAMGLISFYSIEDNIVAVVFSALLLGVSTGLGYASQMTFASNLQVSKAYGVSDSMGMIRSIERGGQAIGPLLFASLGFSFGGNIAVLMVGVVTLLLAVAFYSVVKKEY